METKNKREALSRKGRRTECVDTISLNEETTIWSEGVEGKNKKGCVFGIGSEATEIGSSSTGASTSQASNSQIAGSLIASRSSSPLTSRSKRAKMREKAALNGT
ncbi:uncharacterized protein G2W53_007940 [Senna tora]|uniref:Uncharacterized protein n=1 Tax=Senna tora TaxID=362788 RepID=A0A834X952_9FABA|nr:uncharacterized protein G2W53_007940 [Senna tora]